MSQKTEAYRKETSIGNCWKIRLKKQVFRPKTVISPLQASEIKVRLSIKYPYKKINMELTY